MQNYRVIWRTQKGTRLNQVKYDLVEDAENHLKFLQDHSEVIYAALQIRLSEWTTIDQTVRQTQTI